MSIFYVLFSVPDHIYFSKYAFRLLPIIITQDSERLLFLIVVIVTFLSCYIKRILTYGAGLFLKSSAAQHDDSARCRLRRYAPRRFGIIDQQRLVAEITGKFLTVDRLNIRRPLKIQPE